MCCIQDICQVVSYNDIAKHKRYDVIHMHTLPGNTGRVSVAQGCTNLETLLHVTLLTSNRPTSRWLVFGNGMQPWYGVKNLKTCFGCKCYNFEHVTVYVDRIYFIFVICKKMSRTIFKIFPKYLNQTISTMILIFNSHSKLRNAYNYRSIVFVAFPQGRTYLSFSELCVLYNRK